MTWTAIGPLDDLWEGDIRAATIDGHEIVVLRVDGGDVHVYQGICPHQEQRLADGDFDGRKLTCAGHLWEFDATTGAGINPRDCALARYPVEVRDGEIHVRVAGVVPTYSF